LLSEQVVGNAGIFVSLAMEQPVRFASLPRLRLPLMERRHASLRSLRAVDAAVEKSLEPSGTTFSDLYDLGHTIGAGTTSVVRLAMRKSDHAQVAVKCVRDEDDEQQQFIRDEFKILRLLSHAAIVRAFAMFEQRVNIWICMEFCEGGSVEAYVEKHGVFSEQRSTLLSFQLLHGVNYLHTKRVVHRDLKPANLLLTSRAECLKITDFNSARIIGTAEDTSVMLSERGTYLYAAPEVRFGHLWNERVDVWACGICIFYLLRANLPFNSSSRSTKLVLLRGKLPDICWGGISEMLTNLIQQCLTVNMRDRPPPMELLLHSVFDHSECRQWQEANCKSEFADLPMSPRILESREIFELLPSCGLRAVGVKESQLLQGADRSTTLKERFSEPRRLAKPGIDAIISWCEEEEEEEEEEDDTILPVKSHISNPAAAFGCLNTSDEKCKRVSLYKLAMRKLKRMTGTKLRHR
jgi:serine/threonine protein kinase